MAAILGIGACSAGPHTVSVPLPQASNTELGQDVPNDQMPGVPAATIRCADPLHQAFPGGSDYIGPPVPGCGRPY